MIDSTQAFRRTRVTAGFMLLSPFLSRLSWRRALGNRWQQYRRSPGITESASVPMEMVS